MTFFENISWYFSNVALETSLLLQYACFSACLLILFAKPQKTVPGYLKTAIEFLLLFLTEAIIRTCYHGLFASRICANLMAHTFTVLIGMLLLDRHLAKATIIMGTSFLATELCMNSLAGVFAIYSENLNIFGPASSAIRNGIIILAVFAAAYIRHFNIKKYKLLPSHLIGVVLTYSLTSLGLSGLFSFNEFNYDIPGYLFCGITFFGLTLVNLIGYYMLYRICNEYNHSLEYQARAIKTEGESSMLQLYTQNREEIRKIRHDLKNHFSYMRMMIDQNDYNKLNGYFSELEKTVQQMHSAIDCGNPTVNAVLNVELMKMKKAGISFDTKLAIPPVLPFSDNDMVSLLSNLLDNAIEACERYQIKNAVIELGMRLQQEYIYLCVTNPITEQDPKHLLSLKTSKENREAHGYGSLIVNDIIHKNNGEINRSIINGKFVVDVMLELTKSARKGRNS